MANVKQVVGARTAITTSGFATLANGAYATSNPVNNTANQPLDLLVELTAIAGTVSGNKQAVLFALGSIDGTNYQTGANSTDEAVMTFVGTLPLNTSGQGQQKPFSIAAAFGGALPPYVKFVVKNDSGSAFSNATLNYAEVSGTVT